MQSIELIKGSDGTGNASVATVQSSRSPGATTIVVDTVLGINPEGFAGTMGTPHTFTDPITSETITVISEATAVDFIGHIDSGNIEIDTIAPGYVDGGSQNGDIIVIRPTTQYADNLADVLAEAHNDDGSLNKTALHMATPAGAVLPYAGSAAPSGFLLCNGASVLRATYPDLFTAIGTAFGSVDGTHFTLPDMRGRTPVGVGSGTKLATFASRSSNIITVTGLDNTADNEFQTGQPVLYLAPSGAMTGLVHNTTYYVIRITNTTFSLATTQALAVAGTPIALSSNGTGTQTFTLSLTARTLAENGGEEDHATTSAEMPSHNHAPGTVYNNTHTVDSGATSRNLVSLSSADSNQNFPATAFTGSSAAHNNMQPFIGLNYIIKV